MISSMVLYVVGVEKRSQLRNLVVLYPVKRLSFVWKAVQGKIAIINIFTSQV